MKCSVCGREIGYAEDFRQHETTKEELCMSAECLHTHMLQEITLTDLQEFTAGEPELLVKITMGGLEAMSADDMQLLVDWYEQFYHTCENDEPDQATARGWEADNKYQNSEYYQMVMPN